MCVVKSEEVVLVLGWGVSRAWAEPEAAATHATGVFRQLWSLEV